MRSDTAETAREMRWTPRLIKQLRGRRTQAQFGALLGAPKNTVWRWEAGLSRPDPGYLSRLSKLAARERFLDEWELVGSVKLRGDLEGARAAIAALFSQSVERSAGWLAG